MSTIIAQLESQIAAAASPRQTIDAMNALAWALCYQDPARAHTISEQSRALATSGAFARQHYHYGLAASLRNLGHAAARLGKPSGALAACYQALALFETLNRRREQAQVWYVLTYIYWGLGDYATALEYGFQTLRLSASSADRTIEARAENMVGLTYLALDDPTSGQAHYDRSLQLFEQLGDIQGQCDVLSNRCELHLIQGDHARALADGHASLQLHEQIGYTRDIGVVLQELAQVYLAMHDYAHTLSLLQQSLRCALETGNRFAELLARLRLGQVHAQCQSEGEAHTMLAQSLAIAQELGAKAEQAECHRLLADLHERAGDFQQALGHYQHFHSFQIEVVQIAADQRLRHLLLLQDAVGAKHAVERPEAAPASQPQLVLAK